jgi:WD40 repeat protein
VALAGAALLLGLRWNEQRQFERSRRFDAALTHSELRTLPGHQDAVWAVAYSPDGHLLVSSSGDGTLRVWDPTAGRSIATFNQGGASYSLAFAPEGNQVSAATQTRIVQWDLAARKQVVTLSSEHGAVTVLAMSRDGQLLAAGTETGAVLVWDRRSGRLVATIVAHRGVVTSLAFSWNLNALASGGTDSELRTWNLADSQPRASVWAHWNTVRAVAFSPDGRFLVSGGGDNS